MYILWLPKEPRGFWYENPKFSVLPGRVNAPAGSFWISEVDPNETELLNSLYYLELTQEETDRAWKFWGNYAGYVKIVAGTEDSLRIVSSREFIDRSNLQQLRFEVDPPQKVKYYLTEQDIALTISFMKKVMKFTLSVRAEQRKLALQTMDPAEAAVFTETDIQNAVNATNAEIDSATTMEQLCIIEHTKFGMRAPEPIALAHNLSVTTSIL